MLYSVGVSRCHLQPRSLKVDESDCSFHPDRAHCSLDGHGNVVASRQYVGAVALRCG